MREGRAVLIGSGPFVANRRQAEPRHVRDGEPPAELFAAQTVVEPRAHAADGEGVVGQADPVIKCLLFDNQRLEGRHRHVKPGLDVDVRVCGLSRDRGAQVFAERQVHWSATIWNPRSLRCQPRKAFSRIVMLAAAAAMKSAQEEKQPTSIVKSGFRSAIIEPM